MKKTLLPLLAGLSFCAAATAQTPITLKWADYGRFPPVADRVFKVNDLLPLANISSVGTNAVWDLTGFSANNQELILRDSVQVINSGGFPGYVYTQPEMATLGNIPYYSQTQFLRDTLALVIQNKNIALQTIDISSLTGVPTDRFFIPQQQVTAQDSAELVLKFPATLDSSWSATSYYVFNYGLKVAAAQYNNQPVTHEVTKRVLGKVIGWGKAVTLNYDTGRPGDSMEVLQVQIIEATTNNFTGADPIVLNALNLQSSQDTTSYIWLMRKGETTPLLSVRYHGVPSSTPEAAWIHKDRIPTPLSVNPIATTDAVKIYPNPVRRGGVLFVDCQETGNWQFRLTSLTGQQVQEARWSQTQTGVEAIQLPQHLAEGLYIFQLSKNNQPVKTGRVFLSE